MESNRHWPPAKRRRFEKAQNNTHDAALRSGNEELQQPQAEERFNCHLHQILNESDDQHKRPISLQQPSSSSRGSSHEVAGSGSSGHQATATLFQTTGPVRPATTTYDASFSWQQTQYSLSAENNFKDQSLPSSSSGIAQHSHKWSNPHATLPRLPHLHTSAHIYTIQTQDLFDVPTVSNQRFVYNQTESRLQYDKDPVAPTIFPGVGREYTPEKPLASQAYGLETEGTAQQNENVCFGMVRSIHMVKRALKDHPLTLNEQISHITGKCRQSGCSNFPRNFAVEILSSETFAAKDQTLQIRGRILPEHAQIIQGLLDETSLELEVSGIFDAAGPSTKVGNVFVQRQCSLAITIYGPADLFEEIGTWFQEYNVYLQDPTHAERQNARYCNPHRLSVEDLSSCPLISEFLIQNSKLVGFEEVGDHRDILDILSTHADLPETEQPSAVCTRLEK